MRRERTWEDPYSEESAKGNRHKRQTERKTEPHEDSEDLGLLVLSIQIPFGTFVNNEKDGSRCVSVIQGVNDLFYFQL